MMELMRDCFAIEAFGSHEMSIFVKPRVEPDLYCSKRPRDILFVRPLLRLDEHLWVVFLMRDPRDVIVSEHKRRPGAYWCHLGVWKRRYAIARSLWQHPRFVVVRYEDLAARPDAVQEELEARMPFLRRTRRFSEWGHQSRVSEDSEVALGSVRPVSTGSVGSWRERKGRVKSQVEKYGSVHRELIDLGYEESDAWLRSLEGVAPDHTPSVYADTPRSRGGLALESKALGASLLFHARRLVDTARYALGLSRRIDLGEP